jgi:hypothetical protein
MCNSSVNPDYVPEQEIVDPIFASLLSIAVAIIGLVIFFIKRYCSDPLASYVERRTALLDAHAIRYDYSFSRAEFAKRLYPTMVKARSAQHPDSKAARDAFLDFSNMFACSLGLKPFYYQMSVRDQKRGHDGSLQYYWARDAFAEPRENNPSSEHLMVLVDTDYYVHMKDFLS